MLVDREGGCEKCAASRQIMCLKHLAEYLKNGMSVRYYPYFRQERGFIENLLHRSTIKQVLGHVLIPVLVINN